MASLVMKLHIARSLTSITGASGAADAARDEATRIEDETDRAEGIARVEQDAAAHAAPPATPPVRPTERALQALAYLERGRAALRRRRLACPKQNARPASCGRQLTTTTIQHSDDHQAHTHAL